MKWMLSFAFNDFFLASINSNKWNDKICVHHTIYGFDLLSVHHRHIFRLLEHLLLGIIKIFTIFWLWKYNDKCSKRGSHALVFPRKNKMDPTNMLSKKCLNLYGLNISNKDNNSSFFPISWLKCKIINKTKYFKFQESILYANVCDTQYLSLGITVSDSNSLHCFH